jgi:hypothetical protein
MIHPTAKMSPSVVVVTTLVLLLTFGTLVAAAYQRSADLLALGGFMSVVCAVCYLLTPVGYEVADSRLTVKFHLGALHYGPVMNCASLVNDAAAGRLTWTVRVFGNGGLFAGTGIYWNRWLGFFRAYVTSARHKDLVLIDTPTHKIVISPQDPQSFIAAA